MGELLNTELQTSPPDSSPVKLIIEGIDRLGKDTLIRGIQDRRGYHLVLHYTKPIPLAFYEGSGHPAGRQYQEASFRTMFQMLRVAETQLICNRSHLGECVYAPLYRHYSGDYVFQLEQLFEVAAIPRIRLVLLTEDFSVSTHFRDDGLSLGAAGQRQKEQALFLEAFGRSTFADKRVVCVTDTTTGGFRSATEIVTEALK